MCTVTVELNVNYIKWKLPKLVEPLDTLGAQWEMTTVHLQVDIYATVYTVCIAHMHSFYVLYTKINAENLQ